MNIYRLLHTNSGKSGLFIASDALQAKHKFIMHFQLPWTQENWIALTHEIDIEIRPINEYGFIDLSEDYGPNGNFSNSIFKNQVDE
jgi:hypothetical protein